MLRLLTTLLNGALPRVLLCGWLGNPLVGCIFHLALILDTALCDKSVTMDRRLEQHDIRRGAQVDISMTPDSASFGAENTGNKIQKAMIAREEQLVQRRLIKWRHDASIAPAWSCLCTKLECQSKQRALEKSDMLLSADDKG